MKAKRAKKSRKLMQQYAIVFGLREPYQVLLTASLVLSAAQHKMQLGHMLQNTLQGHIKPMITQCSIRHLYNLPADFPNRDACIEVAKQAERRRCGHHELEEPLTELECLLSVVDPKEAGTNKHRYVVATQEVDVRQRMRKIAGVPLVYINRSVMILEPMAARSEQVREAEEKGKVRAGLKGRRSSGAGEKRKRDDEDEQDDVLPERARRIAAGDADPQDAPVAKKRKVKGPKGPNPLSVKKPKKDQSKPAPRQNEDERAVIRRATKNDPQAAQKADGVETVPEEQAGNGVVDGVRKRKRKRRPKEHAENEAALNTDLDE